MSFIKKAVKKVVDTVKKIVKSKVFKIIAIAALTFFTAGVAAGGFAAFSGVSSIGGFFTAVGQTIATGASAIAGGLGFQGVSSTLAGYGGAAAEAAGLTAGTGIANAAGVTLAGAAGPGASVTTNAVTGAVVSQTGATVAAPAGTGFLSSVKGVLGKKVFGEVTVGELASKGIMAATAGGGGSASKKKFANSYVAGGLARGGGDRPEYESYVEFGEAPQQEMVERPTPQADAQQEFSQSLAAQYAQGSTAPVAPPSSRIQQMLQERGQVGGGLVAQQQQQALGQFAQQPQQQVGLVPATAYGAPEQEAGGVADRRFNSRVTRMPYGGGLV